MARDQPAHVGRQGPLDDLRERLARLPDSHPSSPGYGAPGDRARRAADARGESGAARGEDAASRGAGGEDGTARGAGRGGGGEDGTAATAPGAWMARVGRGRAAGAGPDRLRQLDRLARLLGPERRGGADGAGGARGSGAGARPGVLPGPRRRGAYRPWFADADPPWFTSDDPG